MRRRSRDIWFDHFLWGATLVFTLLTLAVTAMLYFNWWAPRGP